MHQGPAPTAPGPADPVPVFRRPDCSIIMKQRTRLLSLEFDMTLTKITLERFTAFSELELPFSPGINVLIGANSTGKTHLMKVCYAACDVAKTGAPFIDKLVRVFLPSGRTPGRLVHRQQGSNVGQVAVHRGARVLQVDLSSRRTGGRVRVSGARDWADPELESAYIPVKEMLSNAPGFLSLYASRAIHFEEVYADILHRAYLPVLRGPMDARCRQLITRLRAALPGNVVVRNEEFFLRNRQGSIEFSLLAEGIRKLALLWLLIQNGTLPNGSVLFWDEPETNLNPSLFGAVISILLELQRAGVQIFLATHDYVILEEIDLQMQPGDRVAFHSLYRDDDGKIICNTTADYRAIAPNAIADTFDDLYDRAIKRSLGGH